EFRRVLFRSSWLNDRLSATFTYFSQKTTDALMDVSGMPSLGFSDSQLENVGELENKGVELQIDGAIVQGESWGLDAGLGVSTAHSKVLDLGGIEPFNALSGRLIEGHSVPVAWDRRVADPDGVGAACCGLTSGMYENDGNEVVIAPKFPTHFVTPSISLRTPGNIVLSARGEYRGGNMVEINPIAVDRSVRSPICF